MNRSAKGSNFFFPVGKVIIIILFIISAYFKKPYRSVNDGSRGAQKIGHEEKMSPLGWGLRSKKIGTGICLFFLLGKWDFGHWDWKSQTKKNCNRTGIWANIGWAMGSG